MASPWYFSWFPNLPLRDFVLPSRLQGRFISFALKKSLGHFLKPGQLDAHQIDSQIGSGYVQINDLELDNQAINTLLHDLPVRLHDGSITSVTARIPLPNPLTSSVGLALNGLHLTLHVVPLTPCSPKFPQDLEASISSLAESMVSVAESFVHDELNVKEGAELWQSFHSATHAVNPDTDQVPGGLDPFISAPEEEVQYTDTDPAGVSLFASLIERLLAKFEFDATDTKITLVRPDTTRITASLAEIKYRTEDKLKAPTIKAGEKRTLSFSGLQVGICDLRPVPVSELFHKPQSSPTPQVVIDQSRTLPKQAPKPPSLPVSPTSSVSSLDEETQLAMSQSLAFLPPRPSSPASSVASSMYESALSGALTQIIEEKEEKESGPGTPRESVQLESSRSTLPLAPVAQPRQDTQQARDREPLKAPRRDELIFSFGTVPIQVQVTTPSPQPAPIPVSGPSTQPKSFSNENIQVVVTTGVLAGYLRPWHVSALSSLAADFGSSTAPPASARPKGKEAASPLLKAGIHAECKVRGVVLLFLPNFMKGEDEPDSDFLQGFFSRPLVPPRLPHVYFRLHLESLKASFQKASPKVAALSRERQGGAPSSSGLSFTFSIDDLSVFSIENTGSDETTALPLIITDHLLPSQYPSDHTHVPRVAMNDNYPQLPVFDIVDWTDKRHRQNGMKLSAWRTRPPKHKVRKHNQSSPVDEEHAYVQEGPALLFRALPRIYPSGHSQRSRSSVSEPMDMEVLVAPLHVYIDLGSLLRNPIIDSFSEALNAGSSKSPPVEVSEVEDEASDDDITPPPTPRARKDLERENERKRLERMVLEDLDLEFDYLQKKSSQQRTSRRGRKQAASKIKLNLAMIRLEVRTPSPPKHNSVARSGALVLDLHELQLFNGPLNTAPRAHFGDDENDVLRQAHAHTLASLQVQRILMAASPTGSRNATTLISLGALQDYADELPLRGAEQANVPLQPRVSISKSQSNDKSVVGSLIIIVDIPSLHCHVTKELADALQYWADDVAQLLEARFKVQDSNDGTDTEPGGDGSLIGSNFFVKTRSGSLNSIHQSGPSEVIVKACLSEAFVRVMLPNAVDSIARPFDVLASDVDILLEVAPEGKDEVVVTTSVMDLTVKLARSHSFETLLALTTPRSMSSEAQSLVKVRFASLPVPGSTGKETRLRLTLWGFTCNIPSERSWVADIQAFIKSPPGTFEAVVPNERTTVALKVVNGSIRAYTPHHPGAVVLHVGDSQFTTEVVGESTETSFQLSISSVALLAIDDVAHETGGEGRMPYTGITYWKKASYALIAELQDTELAFAASTVPKHTDVTINKVGLRLHLCADSMAVVIGLITDLTASDQAQVQEHQTPPKAQPAMVSQKFGDTMLASIDDIAFKQQPEIGPTPDMIYDNLPTNMDYLDESFGAAAGLRELTDDDLEDFVNERALAQHSTTPGSAAPAVNVATGGETIKVYSSGGINVEEYYFDHIPTEAANQSARRKGAELSFTVHNADISLFLYDGYDWLKTRKVIEEGVKEMRRRLAKIRQLVASGQTQDPSFEDTSALLFNSVHIGLRQGPDELERNALLAAIDDELRDDIETATQSSWQSLRQPAHPKPHQPRSIKVHGKRLTRSKGPSIEFKLSGLDAEFDQYAPQSPLVSRTLATVRDVEILDHIKTSTWKKFLTELRSDSHGNVRETDSNMVRVELLSVHPVADHPSEEARLRAKLLPLRLYVDQDALDFLKKFFSFKDPNAHPDVNAPSDDGGIYFQLAEVFPVDLKLDYKPRRVDYHALREGRTIELMNFFHFDGAEMTLRHITLSGIKGWPKFFDLLNDLWTPDVKATQLVDVISGVAPIRSVVNVGSGVADLVLLPIAQYKKDGRIVRGVQKGTTAFVKSTAVEAIKLGARLATGTQVILEQAEGVLGGQFGQSVTTETVPVQTFDDGVEFGSDGDTEPDEMHDMISKYAQQPIDIKEGVQHAYKSLRRNLNSAAQTILAVPMEVYERSGSEGAIRSVIRAVPIAVLKPMIGASEAVSKTLLGLHNSLDPNLRLENEAKYK